MKTGALAILGCPVCGGEFALEVGTRDADEVMEGALVCRYCSKTYDVRRGVPRLMPGALHEDKLRTAEAFGWQWLHFVEMHDLYEAEFLDWIHPIRPDFFSGKLVMDAGCGNGRHAQFAAAYGSGEVVAMDFSDAVDTAFQTVGRMPNVHVVQGDIDHPPVRRDGPRFDFIYSIGVLQFLENPEAGFRSLVALLKPGGTIFGWVYGYENNEFVHRFIAPSVST